MNSLTMAHLPLLHQRPEVAVFRDISMGTSGRHSINVHVHALKVSLHTPVGVVGAGSIAVMVQRKLATERVKSSAYITLT